MIDPFVTQWNFSLKVVFDCKVRKLANLDDAHSFLQTFLQSKNRGAIRTLSKINDNDGTQKLYHRCLIWF